MPAVGALLALSAALAAACFVKAFGVTFLGRPRSKAAEHAHETDRFSLAAMLLLAGLCLLAGILPGVLHRRARSCQPQPDRRQHAAAKRACPIFSIVPIAESRSSYNGLLVFLFMVFSASFAAAAIHRLASNRLRRAPAWDCGYPNLSPATQYTASSFAQPIRRVFGTVLFQARDHVDMPPPGDMRPARLRVLLHDPVWEIFYAPVARVVGEAAERLNVMQSLTIRRYLAFVFAALVGLLLVLAIWQ